MADNAYEGWSLQPAANQYADWKLQPAEPEDTHGMLAKGAHYAAKALPLAGGIIGGVTGAAAGPVGAAAGAGLAAAAGKGAQHVIDTALGYEKPIETAAELSSKVDDIGLEGAKTAGAMLAGEGAIRVVSKIPGVKQAAQAIPDAMGNMANRLAARMLKGDPGQYTKLGAEGVQKLGDFLLRNGAVKFGSSPAAVAERIPALEQSTGAALGEATAALDATGARVSKEAMATRLDTLANDAAAKGPGAAPVVAKYRNAAQAIRQEALESGEPMMSFGQAEKWKQGYQDPINYMKRSPTPPEMGSQQIASAARQNVEDAASVAGEGTPLLDNFLKAKKESGFAQQAGEMIKGEGGRDMSRNMLGPTAKAIQFGGAGLALAHGNIPAAGAALLAGPAMQFARARAPAAAAVTLKAGASAAEKLLAIASSNPAALGRYGAILSKALQTGGQQAFDAHAYALSQTDPQFQELNRRLAEGDH